MPTRGPLHPEEREGKRTPPPSAFFTAHTDARFRYRRSPFAREARSSSSPVLVRPSAHSPSGSGAHRTPANQRGGPSTRQKGAKRREARSRLPGGSVFRSAANAGEEVGNGTISDGVTNPLNLPSIGASLRVPKPRPNGRMMLVSRRTLAIVCRTRHFEEKRYGRFVTKNAIRR